MQVSVCPGPKERQDTRGVKVDPMKLDCLPEGDWISASNELRIGTPCLMSEAPRFFYTTGRESLCDDHYNYLFDGQAEQGEQVVDCVQSASLTGGK